MWQAKSVNSTAHAAQIRFCPEAAQYGLHEAFLQKAIGVLELIYKILGFDYDDLS